MDTAPVTCPTCFETFYVALPLPEEVPCALDYDCEVCCRPMVIQCWLEDEEDQTVSAAAIGMDD
ncbi:MAG: CPXCG motif-containing cysteine-rich protein [Verrucomicrobiales bacterium]|nr:CPXCG motif-containing cysteine-rich protein [Verrucomicrobiales bacterium]